jgi:hypothetical protein
VSFSTITTLTGVSPQDLDSPAQSALISILASLLSLDTASIRIDSISDRSGGRRSLSDKRLDLLSVEDITEVSFTTEAVTEALGYSDPDEMLASFEEQLSAMTTDSFVTTFLSECLAKGTVQPPSPGSVAIC